MKNFILSALLLASCSCGLTLSSGKGLDKTAVLVTSTGFGVTPAANWKRLPNVFPIPLPAPSYGDVTLYDKDTETMVFLSTVDRLEDPTEILLSLGNSDPDAKGSQVVNTPEIPDGLERSVITDGSEFRVVFIPSKNKEFTHLIQSMIQKPEGKKLVSDLLKTFKQ